MRICIFTEKDYCSITRNDETEAKAIGLISSEGKDLEYNYFDGKFEVGIKVRRMIL